MNKMDLQKAYDILGLDILKSKGNRTNHHHKDYGHELASEIEVHEKEIDKLKKINKELTNRKSHYISSNESIKPLLDKIASNNNKIKAIEIKIKNITSKYKPDSEFE